MIIIFIKNNNQNLAVLIKKNSIKFYNSNFNKSISLGYDILNKKNIDFDKISLKLKQLNLKKYKEVFISLDSILFKQKNLGGNNELTEEEIKQSLEFEFGEDYIVDFEYLYNEILGVGIPKEIIENLISNFTFSNIKFIEPSFFSMARFLKDNFSKNCCIVDLDEYKTELFFISNNQLVFFRNLDVGINDIMKKINNIHGSKKDFSNIEFEELNDYFDFFNSKLFNSIDYFQNNYKITIENIKLNLTFDDNLENIIKIIEKRIGIKTNILTEDNCRIKGLYWRGEND